MKKKSEQQHLNAYNIRAGLGIRSFALLLFALLLFALLLFALSLSSIFKKESCEQIDLIPLLSISFKKSNLLKKNYFWQFSTVFSFLCQKSEALPSLFARSLFFKDRRDRFTLVVHYKRAAVRESLPSLFTKEWPIHNDHEPINPVDL